MSNKIKRLWVNANFVQKLMFSILFASVVRWITVIKNVKRRISLSICQIAVNQKRPVCKQCRNKLILKMVWLGLETLVTLVIWHLAYSV
jgi:hypothetical protein